MAGNSLRSACPPFTKSAIRDRRLVANPCDGTKLPNKQQTQIVPLTTEQVCAVRDALPLQLQTPVTLVAGTGMRQGECFGGQSTVSGSSNGP